MDFELFRSQLNAPKRFILKRREFIMFYIKYIMFLHEYLMEIFFSVVRCSAGDFWRKFLFVH